MAEDCVRQIAELNLNGTVVIDPTDVPIKELRRLAEVDHVVSMRSYVDLKQKFDDLSTDLTSHRVSFRTIMERYNALKDLYASNPQLINSLRTVAGQIQTLDRDLSRYMLDLHEVEHDADQFYNFIWETINSLQNFVEGMNDRTITNMINGFSGMDL